MAVRRERCPGPPRWGNKKTIVHVENENQSCYLTLLNAFKFALFKRVTAFTCLLLSTWLNVPYSLSATSQSLERQSDSDPQYGLPLTHPSDQTQSFGPGRTGSKFGHTFPQLHVTLPSAAFHTCSINAYFIVVIIIMDAEIVSLERRKRSWRLHSRPSTHTHAHRHTIYILVRPC